VSAATEFHDSVLDELNAMLVGDCPSVAAADACRACHRSNSADPLMRGLCGSCYSRAEVRSCFSTTGEQIADLPRRPGWDGADDDGTDGEPGRDWKRGRYRRTRTSRRTPGRLSPTEQAAVDRQANEQFMNAVEDIVSRAEHLDAAGRAGAGIRAAARLSGMDEQPGLLVAERLVAAGQLVEVEVHIQGGAGRQARGVRRPLAAA
jgi:hypothetical protein